MIVDHQQDPDATDHEAGPKKTGNTGDSPLYRTDMDCPAMRALEQTTGYRAQKKAEWAQERRNDDSVNFDTLLRSTEAERIQPTTKPERICPPPRRCPAFNKSLNHQTIG